ncbi:MAG: hypothetical protein ACRDL7_14800, partial [Gaiellaceae bacterium]
LGLAWQRLRTASARLAQVGSPPKRHRFVAFRKASPFASHAQHNFVRFARLRLRIAELLRLPQFVRPCSVRCAGSFFSCAALVIALRSHGASQSTAFSLAAWRAARATFRLQA